MCSTPNASDGWVDIDQRHSVEISFRVGITREDDAINSPDMVMFKVFASHFSLVSTSYRRAFRSIDEIFRIVAINLIRSRCPINAERVADGRGFKFPTGNLAIRLSSVHALRICTLCCFKSPNMQLRTPYPKKEEAILIGAISLAERTFRSALTEMRAGCGISFRKWGRRKTCSIPM